MSVETVSPEILEVSEHNERESFEDEELDEDSPLVKSIEENGVIQPPLATSEDGRLRVFVGQRRV